MSSNSSVILEIYCNVEVTHTVVMARIARSSETIHRAKSNPFAVYVSTERSPSLFGNKLRFVCDAHGNHLLGALRVNSSGAVILTVILLPISKRDRTTHATRM